jgi:hypothetical protein
MTIAYIRHSTSGAVPLSFGVLVTERGRRDDAQAVDDVRQQTGLAHIQRSHSAVLTTKTGRARTSGRAGKRGGTTRCSEARRTMPARRPTS